MARQINATFLLRLNELIDEADDIADSILVDTNKRVWQTVGAVNPLDIPGLGAGFSRAGHNEEYPRILSDGYYTVGDEMACRIEADHLGAQERAYRLRHSTSVRAAYHAAGRRRGHGDAALGPIARVGVLVQDCIAAGATDKQ